jgi:hypothetical protein
MSIFTLKRKTAAQYNNMSVGVPQFSIEGTRRLQGYVGQDMRGRTILRTPFRGNTPRGSGGCCGTYQKKICVPYGTMTVENSGVVKKSVLSNWGSIRTHFRWIWRPQPFTAVKPGDGSLCDNESQGVYVDRLRNKVLTCIDAYNQTHSTVPPVRSIPAVLRSIMNFKGLFVKPATKSVGPCPTVTKDVGSLDQSVYLLHVEEACTSGDTAKQLSNSFKGAPLPARTSGSGSTLLNTVWVTPPLTNFK